MTQKTLDNIEHNGECRTLAEWARLAGLGYDTLHYRLKNGWPMARALNPARSYRLLHKHMDEVPVTAKSLRSILHYDPATGKFTWLVNRRGRFARIGVEAGTIDSEGRRRICIGCKKYLCSRLAFMWTTGNWPSELVDHINCDVSDDRWENLRLANRSDNGANSRRQKNKVSPGPKGVYRSGSKYRALIGVNSTRLYLGSFNTVEDAHKAYMVAAKKHFGEFARGE